MRSKSERATSDEAKEGSWLIIKPGSPKSLLAALAKLQPLEEEFPAIGELPYEPAEF